ncbi:MAG: hypothetical protein ACAI44_36920 [Candidatus Sericytochromatia bacterium]
MSTKGIFSLALTLMLGTSLGSCAPYPNTVQPDPNQLNNSNDPFISNARLALMSYQEADASFQDSQSQAMKSFGSGTSASSSTSLITTAADEKDDQNDLDVGLTGSLGANTQITTRIDSLFSQEISTIPNYSASLDLFNQAATNFSSELLGTEGVELNSQGLIMVNLNRLRADIRSDLQGDSELTAPLDLNGQLRVNSGNSLSLNQLQAMGYTGTRSNIFVQNNADGSSFESMLLNFKNIDADIVNQVRITSMLRGNTVQEHNLRLESRARGFSRTALRESAIASGGRTAMTSEVTMKLFNGTQIDFAEKRYVNDQGAGTGIGSFSIITQSGQTWSGTMRSVSSASGHLMLMLEPDDSSLGRLMLQEKTNDRAMLVKYNSAGKPVGSAEVNLEAAADNMVQFD